MSGCCSEFRLRYAKHAMLVNNCYPKKDGQVAPRPAELSYLTFYTSSRPGKLTKVGAYLRQKVKRDIRKGRKGNNKISLFILKALVQTCHRDIVLFCRSVVVILTYILDTRDIELIDLACDTFYVFCSYYDGTNLGVDSAYTNDYENLVQRFASFAVYPNDDTVIGLQMKYSGHRALASIVNSSAINSSDIVVLFGIIIPPILATIDTESSPLSAWELSKSGPSTDIRCSAFQVNDLTVTFIRRLATQTLSLLFSLSNGIGVRTSLTPCKDYFTNNQKWWPTQFCESVSELIIHSIQPQYRYLMLTNVLYYLHQPVDMTDIAQVDRFVGNVAILRTILTSNLQLMGIPVLELLTALYTLMMKSLARTGTFYDHKPDAQHIEHLKHYSVQRDLFESIVGLASQSYYTNQWNDIIGYIIAKLRVRPSPVSSPLAMEDEKVLIHDMPAHLYQQCSVRFLDIFQKNAIKALEKETADPNVTFTVETWTPGLEILYDSYQDIRLKFADTLIHFLKATSQKDSVYLTSLYTPSQHSNSTFINQLLKSIYVWIQLRNVDDRNIMAIYQLLCCIPERFDGYGVIRTVPFIFYLQQFALDCVCEDGTDNDSVDEQGDGLHAVNTAPVANGDTVIRRQNRNVRADTTKQPMETMVRYQCSLAAVTLEWMIAVAKIASATHLLDYAQSIKEKRQELHQIPSINLSTQPTAEAPYLEIKDELSEVSDWMERQKVVKVMLEDKHLFDNENGVNLEDKLNVTWGSEDYDKQEKSFRIEIDASTDMKPKLTTATNGTLQHRQLAGKKQVINVENLKGALAAQLLGNEQNEIHHDNHSAIIHDPSEVKTELDNLLSGLNSPTSISSTDPSVSLVNPPY